MLLANSGTATMNCDSRLIYAPILSLLAFLITPQSARSDPPDLTDLAQTYCFSADGDHYATWDRARRDGFTPLRPEDFPNLHLPGSLQLRGFSRLFGETEVRVLTAVTWFAGWGNGVAHYKMCWVSAAPADRGGLDRDLQQFFGQRGFRQLDTRVFASIPMPDGTERPVSLREFQRRGQSLSREQGMKLVLAGNVGDQVTVTYMVPTEDCEDWCYRSDWGR